MTGAMIPVSGVAFAFVGMPVMGGSDDTCTLREHPVLPGKNIPVCCISVLFFPKTEGELGVFITGEYQMFPGS